MCRCRACDSLMSESELSINVDTGYLEDMCFKCKGISMLAAADDDDDVESLVDLYTGVHDDQQTQVPTY